MQSNKICAYCLEKGHSKFYCKKRPRKAINKIGKKSKKNAETTTEWRQTLGDGYWPCYLQISISCLKMINKETTAPEHVIPKSRGQKYAHDINQIKRACAFCNAVKGSRTLENLAKEFPHLEAYIAPSSGS